MPIFKSVRSKHFRANAILASAFLLTQPTPSLSDTVISISSFPSFGKNAPLYFMQKYNTQHSPGYEFKVESGFQHALLPLIGGNVQLAQVLYTDALLSMLRGEDIVIIGIRDQISPVATISLRQQSIRRPTDYAHRRWGHSTGFSPETELMKELARLHGFDSASVQITNLAFPMRWPMLASGDVDFIAAWWGSGSTVISQSAKKQNIAIDIVRWSEFGLDIYGEVFVARRDWVESNKDLVHRVLSNLERAYVSCKENPEPCVGAVLDSGAMAVPDRELVMQGWLESSELLGSKRGERGLLGIDPERLTRSARAIGISIADLKRQAYISFAP